MRVFTEAETPKQAGRKAFHQMLSFNKRTSRGEMVLVEKTDRIDRDVQGYVALDIDTMGLELHLVKEGEVLSKESRSHQKLIHRIKVVMAQNYVDNLSEEVVKGLDQKAKEGKWPTYAPFGYQNDLGQHTLAAPRGSTRRGDALRAGGHGELRPERIAQAVYDFGVRSRRTKRVLVKEEMRRILANPIYSGPFVWKGVTHQGTHAPILTRDLFERANLAMGLKSKKNKHNFVFTGILRIQQLAEEKGFEPLDSLHRRRFSKPLP